MEFLNQLIDLVRTNGELLEGLAALVALILVAGAIFSPVGGAVRRAFARITDGGAPPRIQHAPLNTPESLEAAEAASPADPASPMPAFDRPTIAVLPLNNMSGDPDQDYLADGLTEDIITLMSRTPGFNVIARNSTFVYKGQNVDVRALGREMGVRYVVEGSLRKVGERLRVTVQLIEAESASHIWAEKYDRPLDEFFDLQDEVTQAIVAQIQPQLKNAEIARHEHLSTDDLGAWALIRRASHMFTTQRNTRKNMNIIIELAKKAIELDPTYAEAYGILSRAHSVKVMFREAEDSDEELKLARQALDEMRRLAPNDAQTFHALGQFASASSDTQRALGAYEEAYTRNPNEVSTLAALGLALARLGRVDEGLEKIERAIELSPQDPGRYSYHFYAAMASLIGRQMEQALDHARQSVELFDEFPGSLSIYAGTLAFFGRRDEAKAMLERLHEVGPGMTRDDILNGVLKSAALDGNMIEAFGNLLDEVGIE